jgi:DNA repair protein RadC
LEKLAFFKSESFILAHNHPGGVAEESEEDVRATISLDNALKTCGVSIKAHYVIASSECNEIKFREK